MAGFTFADFRKQRQKKPEEKKAERRPNFSSQEEQFLYSLHLKTIEYRTLMATLKATMTPSEFNQFIVDYAIRLRKAKKNFEANNWNHEWEIEDGNGAE